MSELTKETSNLVADFDWSKLSKKQEGYSPEERKKLDEIYQKNLTSVKPHTVVEGTVVSMNDKEVVVNIGYKSDGVIAASEFRYSPDLKVGDKVDVYIEKVEDKTGQIVLSHKKARASGSWKRVVQAYENGEVVIGYIKCRTKGGLIVDVFGLEAFLPGSQIDVKPIKDYDAFVGNKMEFKVVKINEELKNVVVSHKALIEDEVEKQKAEIISKLEKGQILEGTVKNITSYGVFVDLGGIDGLIHITDLAWGRISHPEDIVKLDQKIQVVILDFDDEKKRIQLGYKQLQPHPWDNLDPNLKVGDKVKGKIVAVIDYGAFLEIMPGIEGLIHVSEMSWNQHLRTAHDFVKVGDEVEAVVLSLDREEKKISFGMKQLTPDPWANILEKYPVGSRHKGTVRNVTAYGLFVELEPGVDGLVHISDLSWDKKVKHPSEIAKKGDEIEVVVLEVDTNNRQLKLGHKQLQENPWDVYETIFTVGSTHKGTIISKDDKKAIVSLTYGVEGIAPVRQLIKEDGKMADVDETLDFKVIEFDKDAKKIVVSHTRTFKDEQAKEKEAVKENLKKINESVEKTTLGDILKEKISKKSQD
ncbi:MAG: 30S ribosomal protein S1 [Bacteroidetes bacterium]|nr:MAG: 30S ribosomal protein S1 [Bacteroidota bacterium]